MLVPVCVCPLTVNKHSKAANIKKSRGGRKSERRRRWRMKMLRKRFINVHKDCG